MVWRFVSRIPWKLLRAVCLVLAVGFFALSWGLVVLCERL